MVDEKNKCGSKKKETHYGCISFYENEANSYELTTIKC